MRISDWSSDVCSSDLAEKLLMLTDVEGLYTDWPDRTSLVSEIDTAALTPLLPRLETGMAPKLEACLRAVAGGVPSAHVIGGRVARRSVVQGKSVSVRVRLGGRRVIKKKHKNVK